MKNQKTRTVRKPKDKLDQTFASMKQCSGITGINLDVLKAIKARGCPAFLPSGRIDGPKLRAWLSKHPQDTGTDEAPRNRKDRLIDEQIRRLQLANDRKAGELMEIVRVKQSIAFFNARLDSYLSRLENEWPSLLAGLEPPAIRAYLRRGTDEIRAEISRCYGVWTC